MSLDLSDIPEGMRSVFQTQLEGMAAETVPVAFGHAARARSDKVVGWFWACAIDEDCLVNAIRLTALSDYVLQERPQIDYAVLALMTSSDTSLMNEVWERREVEEGLPSPTPLHPVLEENVAAFEMRAGGYDLVLAKGSVHDNCNVCMRRSFLERLAERDPSLGGLYDAMGEGANLNSSYELRSILRSINPARAARPGAALHFRGKVYEAISALGACLLATTEEAGSDLVTQVKTIVGASISNPPTIDELADQLYMGRTSLCERFKRATGMSVGAYVTRLRMEEAKLLLSRGDMPIADVARAVGYRDASSFSTAFKREEGSAPRTWRGVQEVPVQAV